ncbi:MAG: PAS domain S-box protein [Methanocellales archaeon]
MALRYFKEHWLGYFIASLGIILNAIYLYECTKQGIDIYKHITSDIVHHAVIFSTIPLFLIIGFLADRKKTLEKEIREYTEALNQKIKQLKESEERYKAFLDDAAFPIFILDREGKFTWGNKKVKDLTGYHASELTGKSIAQLLSQDNPRELLDRLSNLTRAQQFEVEIQGKYERRIVELRVHPVEIVGEAREIQCIALDVTEKKEMEQEIIASYRYLSSVISNSADAIIALDENGKIVLFNEAAEKIFGYRREEVLHTNIEENGEVKFFADLETARRVMKTLRESKEGRVTNLEVRGRTKYGKELYFSVSVSLIKDQDGKIAGSIGIAKDITDKKLAEQALRESERRYRELFENAYDAIFTVDLNGFITSMNEAGARVSGYTREELIGMNISKLLPPEELERAREELKKATAKEPQLTELEYEIIRKDGSRAIIELTSHPNFEGERITGVHCIARDITERKKLEQRIADSERYLKNIIESTGDAIIALDTRGNIVLFNDGAERIFGYKKEEVIGKNIIEDKLSDLEEVEISKMDDLEIEEIQQKRKVKFYRDIESAKSLMRAMRRSIDGRVTNYEVPGKTKDGRDIYLSVSASLLRNEKSEVIGNLGVIKDITERKKLERELSSLLRFQNEMLDTAVIWIDTLDTQGNVTFWNKAAECISGYSREEVRGHGKIWEWLYPDPDYRARILEKAMAIIQRGEKVENFETVIRTKKGEKRVISWHSNNLLDETGKIVGSIALGADITERKLAEEEIKRSRDMLAAINSLLQLSLENISLDEILNRALELILSIPWLSLESRGCIFLVQEPGELVMKVQKGLTPAIQNSCARVAFGKCICGRAALEKELKFASQVDEKHETKYMGITPHGHYCVPIIYAGKVLGVINLYLREGHGFEDKEVGFLQAVGSALAGIIERKQLEQEILEAKEAAELYVDIMAHDINNLNQIGLGYLDLLLASELEEKQKKYAEKALNSVLRSVKLIEDVRLIQRIREASFELQAIDLNEVIAQVIAEFSASAQKQVIFKYNPRVGSLAKADALIKEVFVNLIGNAIKYSGESVEIAINVEEFINDTRFYKVCVEDNGDGVPDELKTKIFKRFERGTKKAKGKGLGLYIVKTLIEKYGGEVWVEDRVKGDYTKGARFCFTVQKAEGVK